MERECDVDSRACLGEPRAEADQPVSMHVMMIRALGCDVFASAACVLRGWHHHMICCDMYMCELQL